MKLVKLKSVMLILLCFLSVSIEAAQRVRPKQPCAEWRAIAYKSDNEQRCPRIEGWKSSNAFPVPKQLSGLESPLESYCVFEALTPDANFERLGKKLEGRVRELTRDCFVGGTMATDLANEQAIFLEEKMDEQMDKLMPKLPKFERPKSRLTFIDTTPTVPGQADRRPSVSRHGYTLANIANRLVCPEGDKECSVDVAATLALPIYQFDPQDVTQVRRSTAWGGYFGSVSDMGAAIMHTVADWFDSGRWGEQSLVINISAGFDIYRYDELKSGRDGFDSDYESIGRDLEKMAPPVRGLYQSIQYARCMGALIIAANGNTEGGLTLTKGPLAPAFWETHQQPSLERCVELTGLPADVLPDLNTGEQDYAPLVYGVSGVGISHAELSNARPITHSRITAYGDHAFVTNPNGYFWGWRIPASVLTGSSVSTAAVSATASLIWALNDKLKPHEVMQLIYEKGYASSRRAEVCLGGDTSQFCYENIKSSRLSYCRAVAAVCPSCIDANRCDWKPELIDFSSLPFAGFDAVTTHQVDASNITERLYTSADCRGATIWYDPAGALPVLPCPQWNLFNNSEAPWTFPQPGETMCPNCTMQFDSITTPEAFSLQQSGFKARQAWSSEQPFAAIGPIPPLPIRDPVPVPISHSYKFFLEIPNLSPNKTINGIALVLDGRVLHLNTLGRLSDGDSIKVSNLVTRFPIRRAAVSFIVDGQYAATAPLLKSK